MSISVRGAEGYAENAQSLIEQWQDISFQEHHESILHLVPTFPSSILDVGAGIGTDAAAFAALGHSVVAVEPVDALRVAGVRQHSSLRIEWLDDSLPDLAILRTRQKEFDCVMLSAVWMHLDEDERRRAIPNVSALMCDGSVLVIHVLTARSGSGGTTDVRCFSGRDHPARECSWLAKCAECPDRIRSTWKSAYGCEVEPIGIRQRPRAGLASVEPRDKEA